MKWNPFVVVCFLLLLGCENTALTDATQVSGGQCAPTVTCQVPGADCKDPISTNNELANSCGIYFNCRYHNVRQQICDEMADTTLVKYIVGGFKIKFEELRAVYEAALQDSLMYDTVDVYAMMGVNVNDETDLVFVVQDTAGNFRSYDFTTPCPPACPKGFQLW